MKPTSLIKVLIVTGFLLPTQQKEEKSKDGKHEIISGKCIINPDIQN